MPQRAAVAAQHELSSAELRRAAELAEAARRTLNERSAQARRDAELERQRQAEEPAAHRWPHRDPGYDFTAMQRRQAERGAAQLAAQDLRTAMPDLTNARRWAEPSHEQPYHQSRQAERDEPEAAL
jgi:hypothetical protein